VRGGVVRVGPDIHLTQSPMPTYLSRLSEATSGRVGIELLSPNGAAKLAGDSAGQPHWRIALGSGNIIRGLKMKLGLVPAIAFVATEGIVAGGALFRFLAYRILC
jgi:hypothetical protein